MVNGLLELIQDSVKAGEKVTLTGCAARAAQPGASPCGQLLPPRSWAGRARAASPPARLRSRGRGREAQAAVLCAAGWRGGAQAAQRRRRNTPADCWSLEIADSAACARQVRHFRAARALRAQGPQPGDGQGDQHPGDQGAWPLAALRSARASWRAHAPTLPAGAGLQRGQVLQGPREGRLRLRWEGNSRLQAATHATARHALYCRCASPRPWPPLDACARVLVQMQTRVTCTSARRRTACAHAINI